MFLLIMLAIYIFMLQTGKGFIKDVEGGGDGFAIRLPEEEEIAVGVGHMTTGFASNPATNEWIPSTEEEVM